MKSKLEALADVLFFVALTAPIVTLFIVALQNLTA